MIRIVLADDHAFMRTGVEAVLESMGMKIVASVGDGDAALDAISREDPDLAIVDVRMPVLDGVDTVKALRARGDTRPVILLTAELEDERLYEAVSAKVNGIVFKDDAETRLPDAIEKVMAGERCIDVALMERALSHAVAMPRHKVVETLSERELKIAQGVAAGKRNKEIATELGTTEGTIKVYLNRIYDKIGVGSRTELAILMLKEK